MHASLSRFLSMKGAGNVIYFNGSNPWGILLAATLPTAFLVPRARHKSEFPAVLHGLDKSSKSVKAQKLNLRHCSWLDFHLKKTKKKTPQTWTVLFFVSLYYVSAVLLLLSVQVTLRKASFCWTFYTFTLPKNTSQLGCFPIKKCVSWHSYRVEHN